MTILNLGSTRPGFSLGFLLLAALGACGGDKGSGERDPHIVPRPDLRENEGFISPPILQFPIYACAQSVVVKGFIPGAKLEVFVDGTPAPIGSAQSWLSAGQNILVSAAFTTGQVVTAKQTFGAATSGPSNAVTVTSHTEDYPSGLPAPRLGVPCLECGKALGIGDAVPGALVRAFAENPAGGGGFAPAAEVGSVRDFGYTFINPQFVLGARVWATQELCTDISPRSATATVQAGPSTVPSPFIEPIHEGVNIAVLWGQGGISDALLNGAALEVFSEPGMARVGGQATPGGGQQVFINPPGSITNQYRATQALCTASPPSNPIDVVPCADQPAATIRPPLPGDTQIELLQFIPGARILVFANAVEIGDGGGPVVQLSRPVADGETIVVLQRIGTCDSRNVYQTAVACSLGGDGKACSSDWPAYRHDGLRTASQPIASALSNPYQVKKLGVTGRFPPAGNVGGFIRGSLVVSGGRGFAASSDGRVYAFDLNSMSEVWRFPSSGPGLTTKYTSLVNSSSLGVASSPAMATIRDRVEVVIFAAPDQSAPPRLGSGRLFAVRASDGVEVWRSPVLAELTGTAAGSTTEKHENLGYSSPLVMGNRVYIGIADHGDSPIQVGRVVAVNLQDGTPASAFSFAATPADKRGGGVWSSVAGGLAGGDVYVTTGNTKCWNWDCQDEPSPNHGLSMLRLNAGTGALVWKLQPVAFDADDDPDWASGASLLSSSCGDLALSTMKDGWSYAVPANSSGPAASAAWQFPNSGFPFHKGQGAIHGDSRYLEPGATWHDIFFTMTGGYEIELTTSYGFGRLHALNACGGGRVRWTLDIRSVPGDGYQLGPPTVTRGIVYIGTNLGELVAIADPSVWPGQGSRCSRPEIVGDCVANGYSWVPIPSILKRIQLGAGVVRTEPVLAGGRVYVGTEGGIVFKLEPGP
jgi:putative pyrroloquinoline-quinone binding quinoprotein